MPKINDLTNRPGGPQPTDEFWLASEGGAADFKSTIAALGLAALSNIDVVENTSTGQWNARIPTGASGGIQVDYNPNGETTEYANSGRLVVRPWGANAYLRSFANDVTPFAVLLNDGPGTIDIATFDNPLLFHYVPDNSGAFCHIRRPAGTPNFVTTSKLTGIVFTAIGRY